jgi:hypothetical protein
MVRTTLPSQPAEPVIKMVFASLPPFAIAIATEMESHQIRTETALRVSRKFQVGHKERGPTPQNTGPMSLIGPQRGHICRQYH